MRSDEWRDDESVAILVVDSEYRVTESNRAAQSLGVPSPGEALAPTTAVCSVAIDLVAALARDGRASPTVARDYARDRYFTVHANRSSTEPFRARILAVNSDAAVARMLEQLVPPLVHDLANLNFSIKCIVESLASELATDGATADHFAHLAPSLTRFAELTKKLALYGEPPRLHRVVVLAEAVMQRALRLEPVAFSQGAARLSLDGTRGPLFISVDVDSVAEALAAMLDNAARHGPPHGKIVFAARLIPPNGAARAQVEIAVEDGGRPLLAPARSKIWEPLHREKRGGLGLGLTLARRVAVAHDGEVIADEAGDGGFKVGMRLPHVLPSADDGRASSI